MGLGVHNIFRHTHMVQHRRARVQTDDLHQESGFVIFELHLRPSRVGSRAENPMESKSVKSVKYQVITVDHYLFGEIKGSTPSIFLFFYIYI